MDFTVGQRAEHRPGGALVGRTQQADEPTAIAPKTGSSSHTREQRPRLHVGGVELDRSDGQRTQGVGQARPVGRRRRGIGRTPDASVDRADVDNAGVRRVCRDRIDGPDDFAVGDVLDLAVVGGAGAESAPLRRRAGKCSERTRQKACGSRRSDCSGHMDPLFVGRPQPCASLLAHSTLSTAKCLGRGLRRAKGHPRVALRGNAVCSTHVRADWVSRPSSVHGFETVGEDAVTHYEGHRHHGNWPCRVVAGDAYIAKVGRIDQPAGIHRHHEVGSTRGGNTSG